MKSVLVIAMVLVAIDLVKNGYFCTKDFGNEVSFYSTPQNSIFLQKLFTLYKNNS